MKSVAMLIRTSLWQPAHQEHRQRLPSRAFWIGCAGPIHVRHYFIRTEATYIDWARRFIFFHDKRHPLEMGVVEVTASF